LHRLEAYFYNTAYRNDAEHTTSASKSREVCVPFTRHRIMETVGTDNAYTLGGESTLLYRKLLGAGGFGQVHEVRAFRV
jgi:hypothetical protein